MWPSQGGQGDQPNSSGLSGGAVAGIIIALLILLAIGVVFVVVIIVVYTRREEWGFKIYIMSKGSNVSTSESTGTILGRG